MKKYIAILLCMVVVVGATAQEKKVVYLNNGGDYATSSAEGNLNLSIGGMNLEFKSDSSSADTSATRATKPEEKVAFSYAGASTKIDHIAIVELGANVLSNASYDIYTPEEAAMLPFSNRKSVYLALTPLTMSAALNKRRSLSFNMGIGFAVETYKFAGNYSMKYDGGVMCPIALEGDNITKSKLTVTYLHYPILFNYNFQRKFFIAAGINLDIAMGSKLKYKKPKTTIEEEVTINPVQVGLTARVGWGKFYGFVNYSLMEMFKRGTGPGGKRLSAGVGLFF